MKYKRFNIYIDSHKLEQEIQVVQSCEPYILTFVMVNNWTKVCKRGTQTAHG